MFQLASSLKLQHIFPNENVLGCFSTCGPFGCVMYWGCWLGCHTSMYDYSSVNLVNLYRCFEEVAGGEGCCRGGWEGVFTRGDL